MEFVKVEPKICKRLMEKDPRADIMAAYLYGYLRSKTQKEGNPVEASLDEIKRVIGLSAPRVKNAEKLLIAEGLVKVEKTKGPMPKKWTVLYGK